VRFADDLQSKVDDTVTNERTFGRRSWHQDSASSKGGEREWHLQGWSKKRNIQEHAMHCNKMLITKLVWRVQQLDQNLQYEWARRGSQTFTTSSGGRTKLTDMTELAQAIVVRRTQL
jgi:hypothetical protein